MKDVGKSGPKEDRATRAYVEQLRDVPLLRGQVATGTVSAGDTFGTARHSLGAAYSYAVLCGASAGEPLIVLTPEGARQVGVDPREEVAIVTQSAVAADTDFAVWVW